jgi:sulfur-carrier protein
VSNDATTPVTLVYFAWVRERIGKAREDVALPANVATVQDLIGWLKAQGPEYESAFGAREVAFFPPVTGG